MLVCLSGNRYGKFYCLGEFDSHTVPPFSKMIGVDNFIAPDIEPISKIGSFI